MVPGPGVAGFVAPGVLQLVLALGWVGTGPDMTDCRPGDPGDGASLLVGSARSWGSWLWVPMGPGAGSRQPVSGVGALGILELVLPLLVGRTGSLLVWLRGPGSPGTGTDWLMDE